MEKWFITAKKADFYGIADALGISPIMARIMRNRDLIEMDEMKKYLHGSLEDLYAPELLKDGLLAVNIIKDKIREKKKIRIISDYDADGVSSNYILYKGLLRCGALVDYKIPDRIEDGYGINEHLIDQAHADGIDTIITCDNGIAAAKEIAYANALGLACVVTDHHDVPYEILEDGSKREKLPPAVAVVNPKQAACSYPYKSICGAVVAFKFICLLYKAMGIPTGETEAFLQMAALATVCDVMPLQDENRIIVKEGLSRMNHTQITGLAALIEVNGLTGKALSGYHMGFVIGPCINASGRLASAKDALELLLCEDPVRARSMAEALKALNDERKNLTEKGVEDAKAYLESKGHEKDKVLVIYLPDCHESIAGIIAGRIREAYNKPVFVLTKTKEGVKGSGRSIEAYHMFDHMTAIKDVFTKFGGHPMAAGLSMEEDRIEEFRDRLNANANLTEEDFVKKVSIDLALPIDYVSESLIEELELLEPFGTSNERPLFAQRQLVIRGLSRMGKEGKYVRMQVLDEKGYCMDAVHFGSADLFFEELEAVVGSYELDRLLKGLSNHVRMDCTYYPKINDYRGRSLQMDIKNYRFRSL